MEQPTATPPSRPIKAAAVFALVAIAVFLSYGLITLALDARKDSGAAANNPNLMPCPACGREVAKLANTCPHCGFSAAAAAKAERDARGPERIATDRIIQTLGNDISGTVGIGLGGGADDNAQYRAQLRLDGWNTPLRFIGIQPGVFVLSSAGPDGEHGTTDDIAVEFGR